MSTHFSVSREEFYRLNQQCIKHDSGAFKRRGGIAWLEEVLHTNSKTGIGAHEVASKFHDRVQFYGDNVAPEAPSKSLLSIYIGAVSDPMLIVLLIIAALSLAIGLYELFAHGKKDGWYEGVAIVVAVLIVSCVATWNDYDKERRFRQLNAKKQNYTVKVIRGGQAEDTLFNDIVAGDLIQLNSGDAVPADGYIVNCFQLEIDESDMNGENRPVKKDPEGDQFMLSGTRVQNGTGTMIVCSVGTESEYGKTLLTMTEQDDENTPLQDKLDKLALRIGKVGMFFATITFLGIMAKFGVGQWINHRLGDALKAAAITSDHTPDVPTATVTTEGWLQMHGIIYNHLSPVEFSALRNWTHDNYPPVDTAQVITQIIDALLIAVTIVVVAVPEGLPLAVTISLAYSVHRMLQDNAFVRELQACETMGCATTICSDKTGTLTLNRMTVTRAWVGGVNHYPPKLTNATIQNICLNSNANVLPSDVGAPKYQGSPTEGALLHMVNQLCPNNYLDVRRAGERSTVMVWTFDSKKKTMGTLLRVEPWLQQGTAACEEPAPMGGYRLLVKGASEIVLSQCTNYVDANGRLTVLDAEVADRINATILEFARNGLRTFIVAHRDYAAEVSPALEVFRASETPASNLTFDALFGIQDPLRPDVRQCIQDCQDAGIMVRMVTGDNVVTAEHISREAGIVPPGEHEWGVVMEAEEFRELPRKKMLKMLPKLRCLARSQPTDKHLLVSRLQELGEIVSVTGDGTNDAPALKKANVGLAMGSGTEVAKEASAIVILDDNFKSIVRSVVWGRGVYSNVRRFLQFQVTVNVCALLVTFISSFSSSGSPLTALQLLWVNVIMDSFAALALATEPPSDDLLKKKPRDYSKLVTNKMMKHIIVQASFQCLVLLGFFFLLESGVLDKPLFIDKSLHGDDRADVIRALVFNAFVFCQLFNELNCRRVEDELNVFAGLHRSLPFIIIFIITVGMQVIFIFFFTFARIRPLNGEQWGITIGLALITLPLGFVLRLIPVPADFSDDDDEDEEGDEDDDSDDEVVIREPELRGLQSMLQATAEGVDAIAHQRAAPGITTAIKPTE